MSRYSKRHYEDVAKIIKHHLDMANAEKEEEGKEYTHNMAVHFKILFTEDNALFEENKFYRACGFPEEVINKN